MLMERYLFRNYAHDDDHFYMADLILHKGEQIKPHCHNFYEFYVVLQGEFEELYNQKRTVVTKKHAHILEPDGIHCLYGSQKSDENILRNIAVEKELFQKTLSRIGVQTARLHNYFLLDESSFHCYQDKSSLAYGPYSDGAAFDFLMRSILEDTLIAAAMRVNNEQGIPEWLQSTYRAMESEENFSLGVPRLLSLAGRSQEHVVRAFRRYYHLTPTEHINNMRLQHAAQLLQTSDDKIINIIYRCGFNNVSYFNRLFKARYGKTPREFRETKNSFFKSI